MPPRDNSKLVVVNTCGTKLSFSDLFKNLRPNLWGLRDSEIRGHLTVLEPIPKNYSKGSNKNQLDQPGPSGIKNGNKKPTKGSKKDKSQAGDKDSDAEDESDEVDEMNPGGKRKKPADEPPKKNKDNTYCTYEEALRAALWFLSKKEILKPNDKRLEDNPAEVRFNQKYEVDCKSKHPRTFFEYGSICGLGIREKPPPESKSADKTSIASSGTGTTERKLSIEFLRLDWDEEGPHFNAIYLGSKATLYDREGNTGHFYISQLDDECRKAGWEPDTEKRNAAKKKWKAIENKWRADKETWKAKKDEWDAINEEWKSAKKKCTMWKEYRMWQWAAAVKYVGVIEWLWDEGWKRGEKLSGAPKFTIPGPSTGRE
ncbi:hypothetical protein RhiJN_25245 [Ceratobasidium sp. AG-Ba]|nr:hypothetical protein RhiJN_25245 [Ceratobasidium sp. AG-Ba]